MSRTPPDRNATEIRAEQRIQWAEALDHWDGFDTITDPLTETLIVAAGLGVGHHVIDLACGTGIPALAEASVVGPGGHVLGLDLVPEMIVIAQAEASARGLSNTEFRTIESETGLRVPRAHFDAATCRHGLMWMPEPLGAIQELYRVLREGGRIAVSSWSDVARHPVLAIVPEVARCFLDMPDDWPLQPPSPLLSPESLTALLTRAGFIEIECTSVMLPWDEADSPVDFTRQAVEDDDVLALILDAATPQARGSVQREIAERVAAQCPSGMVKVQVETLVAWGTKPPLPC